ncbi:hypothetical protein ABI_05420 [Asticcacaulis biprosthecium C19]|uniref:DUF1365 domain-containing protein n=1 Tax=Asticcacaulis biprosthecium C19 TaxID=715226 RepID=F4QKF7_9CAUL|nr:DUF1365 domain-containing protein [Asticcacaulis biprosthecium]EGF92109.1 hypothetical protein ABI_05420 [Asticcacaulis biprosthecium C19]
MTPCLYAGDVVHERFAPRVHRLRYHIFQVLLDLDRLDDLPRLMSRNRFNLFGFYDRDHGPNQAESREAPLNVRMRTMLAERGLYRDGDRLFLMAMPRVLGFVFNPISLYFAVRDGRVTTVVYEVNNTFGDRHSYVLPVHGDGPIRQHSDKRLHVSPFMDMKDMTYDFDLIAPEARFALKINLRQGERDMLFAGFSARRQDLSDRNLLRLFFAMPLVTLKVVAGIHWEALLIALKGITLKPKPPTARSSISVSGSLRG